MSDGIDSAGPLPPGWEIRFDARTRRHYYIDNYNRTTTWHDPRPRYRSLLQQSCHGSPSHSSIGHGEMTSVQHGSLEFRGYNTVYPSYASYPPPPQPAFQLPPTPFSHLAPSSTLYQDFGSSRPSPIMARTMGKIMGTNAFQQRFHQNAIDAPLHPNTDELVAKINATFPTVSENHIRCLLKKYHNREAVVMSALQVEKHPITTPGPYSTPPLARNLHTSSSYTPIQVTPPLSIRGTPPTGSIMATPPMTIRGSIATPPLGIRGSPPSRGSSPVPRPGSSASSYYGSPRFGEYRQSPRPHSSPKMKLRYLKSVFPKVEETLLLDILATEDNNVMKAAEKLKALGFEKRDTPPPRPTVRKKEEEEALGAKKHDLEKENVEMQKPTPPPRMKTLEEKGRMQARLQGLYSEVPERLIQIAMESAEFDEEKARHILMLQMHDEKENKPDTSRNVIPSEELGNTVTDTPSKKISDSSSGKASCSRQIGQQKKDGTEKKTKSKKDIPKVSRGTSTTEDQEFKSPYLQKVDGRNPSFRKGPNDQLLLPDYMTWNGPNPELRAGHDKTLSHGPNKSILSEKRFTAKGANKDLRKGPASGLAKGSIYSQMTGCPVGESRGQ